MGRASTRQNKTPYQLAREELGLSRERAAELLETIPAERIDHLQKNFVNNVGGAFFLQQIVPHFIEGINHNAVLIAVKGQHPLFLFSHGHRSCSLWRGALLCSSDRIILAEMS